MDFLFNQDLSAVIFRVVILIFSVVIHEVSHGAVALSLGDSTAKDAGRLTLNPASHIDFMGSIVLPLLQIVSTGNVFIAWAKPVPYNPYRLRDQRWGPFFVGVAGPLSNITIAVFFGLIMRFFDTPLFSFLNSSFFSILAGIVFLNLSLAIFNLVPIPPLDGSKALYLIASRRWMNAIGFLEAYGMLVILFLLVFAPHFFSTIILYPVLFLFSLITGTRFFSRASV